MTETDPLDAIPATGKILGLDLGTKTIGVAVSDGMRYSATPLETIKRTKFTQDAERIIELVAENNAVALILGLPLSFLQLGKIYAVEISGVNQTVQLPR